ncbi:hypothetical protein GCM10012319_34750 [Comamonas sp. KCTC 72670]|nr:hypothetical protein GCM10012319_34750 [Comamonas sp. KCTC 72670]
MAAAVLRARARGRATMRKSARGEKSHKSLKARVPRGDGAITGVDGFTAGLSGVIRYGP